MQMKIKNSVFKRILKTTDRFSPKAGDNTRSLGLNIQTTYETNEFGYKDLKGIRFQATNGHIMACYDFDVHACGLRDLLEGRKINFNIGLDDVKRLKDMMKSSLASDDVIMSINDFGHDFRQYTMRVTCGNIDGSDNQGLDIAHYNDRTGENVNKSYEWPNADILLDRARETDLKFDRIGLNDALAQVFSQTSNLKIKNDGLPSATERNLILRFEVVRPSDGSAGGEIQVSYTDYDKGLNVFCERFGYVRRGHVTWPEGWTKFGLNHGYLQTILSELPKVTRTTDWADRQVEFKVGSHHDHFKVVQDISNVIPGVASESVKLSMLLMPTRVI